MSRSDGPGAPACARQSPQRMPASWTRPPQRPTPPPSRFRPRYGAWWNMRRMNDDGLSAWTRAPTAAAPARRPRAREAPRRKATGDQQAEPLRSDGHPPGEAAADRRDRLRPAASCGGPRRPAVTSRSGDHVRLKVRDGCHWLSTFRRALTTSAVVRTPIAFGGLSRGVSVDGQRIEPVPASRRHRAPNGLRRLAIAAHQLSA